MKKRSYIAKRKTVEAKLAQQTAEIQETLEKLKATQDQLIQREKLAGIGQLAAGVAHEINNPLGFITSNISSLELYVNNFVSLLNMYKKLGAATANGNDEEVQALIKEIAAYEAEKSIDYMLADLDELFADVNEGLGRVSKIVKSLRVFSWIKPEIVYETYNLNQGLEDSLLIAQNEIKYYARVEKCLADIPEILARCSEVDQVLLNIIINAVHAIKTRDSENLGLIRITTSADDKFVYCRIEDNGIGITEENLKNIFNPFFTTKAVGEGTGLGLSVSYDIIVNEHHGDIQVDSIVDKGTAFTIKLPIEQDL
ncbi:MAG: ATP-binding protein [Syntrophomonadaceae bacterium]|nr:ATP-binding protein [Syntrophomonadaceae bacterium]